MIEVGIWLFGKPAWELPIEGQDILDYKIFLEKGSELQQRLQKVSKIVESLRRHHWIVYGCMYDLIAYKDGVETQEQAARELLKIGVDPSFVSIMDVNYHDL